MKVDLRAIQSGLPVELSVEQVYERITSEGFPVGATLQPIKKFYVSDKEALAIMENPKEGSEEVFEDYVLHPSFLTGVFQTALINNKCDEASQSQYMPFAVEEILIFKPFTKISYVHSTVSREGKSIPDVRRFNVNVYDSFGGLLIAIKNFSVKAKKSNAQQVNRVLNLESQMAQLLMPNSHWWK